MWLKYSGGIEISYIGCIVSIASDSEAVSVPVSIYLPAKCRNSVLCESNFI